MKPWHGQAVGLVGLIVSVYRKMPHHLQRLFLAFFVAAVVLLGAGTVATLAYIFRQPTLQAQEDAALVALPLFLLLILLVVGAALSASSVAMNPTCAT